MKANETDYDLLETPGPTEIAYIHGATARKFDLQQSRQIIYQYRL